MSLTRRLVSVGLPAVAAACSPLGAFQALTPSDSGSRQVATAAYGPDPRQALDVFAPTSPQAVALPVAIFIYGGSWKDGSRADYGFVGRALAANGFVTIVADYRLFPQVPYSGFLGDCAGAVRWAHDNAATYGGDPRRLVLVGHSAGAYNAAMVALDARYLREAGVDPGSIRAFAGLSGPYDFLPLDPGTAQEVFGDVPDKRATQPVAYVGARSPPAYLATGADDTIVRPKNTRSLAAKLREAGIAVEERVFPGLDHKDTLLALSVLFRGKAPILAEMTAFLTARAGGPRDPG